MPLANAFLREPSTFPAERSYPLALYFCSTCSLVQLLDVIRPDILFRDYIYVTGTSSTMAAHNKRYASHVVEMLDLTAGDLVVEIASNDGSLLKAFQAHGVKTLGVEPASNLAQAACEGGVNTVNSFFDQPTSASIRESHGPARVLVANNVLAHVDDTSGFLTHCRTLLKSDGLLVIEVPYLAEFVDRLEYDTVYHEHLCYFSITTLMRLFGDVGLSIQRVDRVPVHGGSVRIYASTSARKGAHAQEVSDLAAAEAERGLTRLSTFERIAADVALNREHLLTLLKGLKAKGKTIAGYGAPAKGNTLLNYCGIDTSLLPYTVDKNPLKVNLYTPGMHIPVLPVSSILERQPDFLFILAWNFAEEIMDQQKEYRNRGGQFIVPLPTPRCIS